MRIQQLMYTSCQLGKSVTGAGGFQVRAMSSGVTDQMRTAVVNFCSNYTPPRSAADGLGLALKDAPDQPLSQELVDRFPPAVSYYPVEDGAFALTRTCYPTLDASGRVAPDNIGRPGGYHFSHTFIFEPSHLGALDGNTVALAQSELFKSRYDGDVELPELDSFADLTLPADDTWRSLFSQEPYADHLTDLLVASTSVAETDRPVIVTLADLHLALPLIEAVLRCLPPEGRTSVTYRSYERDYRLLRQRQGGAPFQFDILVTSLKEEGSAFEHRLDQYERSFFVFNFPGDRYSEVTATAQFPGMITRVMKRSGPKAVSTIHRELSALGQADQPHIWDDLIPWIEIARSQDPMAAPKALREGLHAAVSAAATPKQAASTLHRTWPLLRKMIFASPSLAQAAAELYSALTDRMSPEALSAWERDDEVASAISALIGQGRVGEAMRLMPEDEATSAAIASDVVLQLKADAEGRFTGIADQERSPLVTFLSRAISGVLADESSWRRAASVAGNCCRIARQGRLLEQLWQAVRTSIAAAPQTAPAEGSVDALPRLAVVWEFVLVSGQMSSERALQVTDSYCRILRTLPKSNREKWCRHQRTAAVVAKNIRALRVTQAEMLLPVATDRQLAAELSAAAVPELRGDGFSSKELARGDGEQKQAFARLLALACEHHARGGKPSEDFVQTVLSCRNLAYEAGSIQALWDGIGQTINALSAQPQSDSAVQALRATWLFASLSHRLPDPLVADVVGSYCGILNKLPPAQRNAWVAERTVVIGLAKMVRLGKPALAVQLLPEAPESSEALAASVVQQLRKDGWDGGEVARGDRSEGAALVELLSGATRKALERDVTDPQLSREIGYAVSLAARSGQFRALWREIGARVLQSVSSASTPGQVQASLELLLPVLRRLDDLHADAGGVVAEQYRKLLSSLADSGLQWCRSDDVVDLGAGLVRRGSVGLVSQLLPPSSEINRDLSARVFTALIAERWEGEQLGELDAASRGILVDLLEKALRGGFATATPAPEPAGAVAIAMRANAVGDLWDRVAEIVDEVADAPRLTAQAMTLVWAFVTKARAAEVIKKAESLHARLLSTLPEDQAAARCTDGAFVSHLAGLIKSGKTGHVNRLLPADERLANLAVARPIRALSSADWRGSGLAEAPAADAVKLLKRAVEGALEHTEGDQGRALVLSTVFAAARQPEHQPRLDALWEEVGQLVLDNPLRDESAEQTILTELRYTEPWVRLTLKRKLRDRPGSPEERRAAVAAAAAQMEAGCEAPLRKTFVATLADLTEPAEVRAILAAMVERIGAKCGADHVYYRALVERGSVEGEGAVEQAWARAEAAAAEGHGTAVAIELIDVLPAHDVAAEQLRDWLHRQDVSRPGWEQTVVGLMDFVAECLAQPKGAPRHELARALVEPTIGLIADAPDPVVQRVWPQVAGVLVRLSPDEIPDDWRPMIHDTADVASGLTEEDDLVRLKALRAVVSAEDTLGETVTGLLDGTARWGETIVGLENGHRAAVGEALVGLVAAVPPITRWSEDAEQVSYLFGDDEGLGRLLAEAVRGRDPVRQILTLAPFLCYREQKSNIQKRLDQQLAAAWELLAPETRETAEQFLAAFFADQGQAADDDLRRDRGLKGFVGRALGGWPFGKRGEDADDPVIAAWRGFRDRDRKGSDSPARSFADWLIRTRDQPVTADQISACLLAKPKNSQLRQFGDRVTEVALDATAPVAERRRAREVLAALCAATGEKMESLSDDTAERIARGLVVLEPGEITEGWRARCTENSVEAGGAGLQNLEVLRTVIGLQDRAAAGLAAALKSEGWADQRGRQNREYALGIGRRLFPRLIESPAVETQARGAAAVCACFDWPAGQQRLAEVLAERVANRDPVRQAVTLAPFICLGVTQNEFTGPVRQALSRALTELGGGAEHARQYAIGLRNADQWSQRVGEFWGSLT